MFLSNCAISVKKKSTFIKNKEVNKPDQFKMNKIVNKFLLTGDTFILELHSKQPEFTYSACASFTKHRKKIQKFRETGNLKRLYRNRLDRACFVHDGAYSDNKDFTKRAISNKILKERAYETARNRNYDGYQRGLASIAYKFFDAKAGSGTIATSKAGACK